MNPRDIEDYKCSSCKVTKAPNYFGWNQRTGARLKTCNYCRHMRSESDYAAKERKLQASREYQAPEVTPEPVLWDAAAEVDTADGNTDTSPIYTGNPIYVDLIYSNEADQYRALNPSSSSAGATSHDCPEPEPEPKADFGSDSD